MNDPITKTVTASFGSRIMNALKWMVFGGVLFICSFAVLYINEWRVDVSEIARTAIFMESISAPSQELHGQLVVTTGDVISDERIGDMYLKKDAYLAIRSQVEMYAWVESSHSETDRNMGWSETRTTTYTYNKQWTDNPKTSQSFNDPVGHENPSVDMNTYESRVTVDSAYIGSYTLDVRSLLLPKYEPLTLRTDLLDIPESVRLESGEYLYIGTWSLQEPTIGDIRIRYSVLRTPLYGVSVYGRLDANNSMITPFYGKKDTQLYRALRATPEEAVRIMKHEHTVLTWVLRAVGFVMMWLGLTLVLRPISVLLDFVPFLWNVGRFAINGMTFIVAAILSIVTILVSMIVHNIIVLIIVVVAILIVMIRYIQNKSKKQSVLHAASAQIQE